MIMCKEKTKVEDDKNSENGSKRPTFANGICFTCIHFADCMFRKRSQTPVFQCNEFEFSDVPLPEASITQTKEIEEIFIVRKGLCQNCSKNKTCTLPGHESGVWHCEEYE
jgi:hypothetical protein